MEQYIPKSVVLDEIERRKKAIPKDETDKRLKAVYGYGLFVLTDLFDFIDNLETKEVDLDKQAEWIANGIMIAVQSAKLHTNVYNPDRKDYDHSHLMQAARRGIELGLKIAQKEK